MAVKGSITLEDAKLVEEFAKATHPILQHADSFKLAEQAKTVGRIAYCAIAEAQMKIRAARLHGGKSFLPYD